MEGPLCYSSYHPYCPQSRRNWTLGTLQPRATGHSRRTREGSKRMEVNTASFQSLKIKARPTADLGRITLTLLMMAGLLDPGTASTDPHQPVKITWRLQNGLTREVLNTTTEIHPPNTTWWPDLYFDLKDLVDTPWSGLLVRFRGFGACPGHKSDRESCGGIQHYFCRSWSRVTSNDGVRRWKTSN